MSPARVPLFVGWVLLVLSIPAASWAGPNAGTLVLHDSGVAYSDLPTYCGVGAAPSDCEHVDSRIDSDDWTIVVWKLYAAFAPCTYPRMTAVYFGVQYDPEVFLLQQRSCGDHETPTASWPASGSGLQVFWDSPRTQTLAEICWFAGYGYPAPEVSEFRVTPHPTAGGFFVDDSVPPQHDPIVAYGTLGFNQPGQFSCIGWAYGACCHVDGTCSVTSEEQCDAPDIWVGCTTCSPEACWIMDATGPEAAPEGMALRMSPNPLLGQAIIRFRVSGGSAAVSVHDAAGRRVRRIYQGEGGVEAQSIPWDGRDGDGRLVPAGAYYLRLEARGERRAIPIVVLR